MTKAELMALLENMGATADTVLDFFTEKVEYGFSDPAAHRLSRTEGLHPRAVYVKVHA